LEGKTRLAPLGVNPKGLTFSEGVFRG